MNYKKAFDELTPQEFAVIYWKSQGFTHDQVAQILGWGMDNVQKYISSAHKKLGLGELLQRRREPLLENEIYPALREWIKQHTEALDNLKPPEEPQLPPKIETVSEQEPDYERVEGEPVDEIPEYEEERTPLAPISGRGPRIPPFVIIVIISLALAGFLISRGWFAPEPTPIAPTFTQAFVQPIQVDSPEPTLLPEATATDEPTLTPTDTPVPDTPTSTPTNTLTPTPVNTPPPPGTIFFDDFEDGLEPFWNRIYGDLLIIEGQLSASEPTLLTIGDSSWTNYKIEYDFVGEFNDCGKGKDTSTLGVRAKDQDNMLLYVFSRCYQEWEYMVDSEWRPIPGTSHGGLANPIYLIFTVEENSFTVHNRSDRLSLFIVEDYPSGPIYLKIRPGAKFDNFKVTILP